MVSLRARETFKSARGNGDQIFSPKLAARLPQPPDVPAAKIGQTGRTDKSGQTGKIGQSAAKAAAWRPRRSATLPAPATSGPVWASGGAWPPASHLLAAAGARRAPNLLSLFLGLGGADELAGWPDRRRAAPEPEPEPPNGRRLLNCLVRHYSAHYSGPECAGWLGNVTRRLSRPKGSRLNNINPLSWRQVAPARPLAVKCLAGRRDARCQDKQTTNSASRLRNTQQAACARPHCRLGWAGAIWLVLVAAVAAEQFNQTADGRQDSGADLAPAASSGYEQQQQQAGGKAKRIQIVYIKVPLAKLRPSLGQYGAPANYSAKFEQQHEPSK